jgi:isopenicillin N synthase-like dioxygenase
MAGADRLSKLKAFDDTKAGVKGLVDAGITTVPSIFHHPPDPHAASAPGPADGAVIPLVDLAAAASDRAGLVAQVRAAAETVGFFQVVNHGVPAELIAETLASVKRFNEEPAEAKRPYYTRDRSRRVRYESNFDLFQSPAANWRDTLNLDMPAPEEEIPPACRGAVPEYTRQVRRLGGHLLKLLSEALGLHEGYLEHDAGCLDGDGVVVACHYYPPCPEPHLTLGATRHSDPGFLTVLLQDGVGGLQVLLGEHWVDVHPVPGALVVNVGDMLQILSNDRFKSVEHRVVATSPGAGARVSAACFFSMTGAAASTRVLGPIVTLTPPRYRSVTVAEFLGYYKDKGLDGRSALDRFRLLS